MLEKYRQINETHSHTLGQLIREKWAEKNIYFRYTQYYEPDDWWDDWVNDRGRLRDEIIDELLGGRNYPSFYDILPKELKDEV